MFSHRIFGIFKILLLAIFLIFPSLVFAKDKPVGRVIAIRGTVEFSHGSKNLKAGSQGGIKKVAIPPWEKAVFHQNVFASDKYRTGQGSRLKILFEDMSLIALGPNSTMKVDSYLYKPEDKLRQGVINMVHGLCMYIVNKSQKNKKSSFKIITPTASISARGTKGYVSAPNANITLLANTKSEVSAKNNDPGISGEVIVGPMMKTIIEKGKPPIKPEPLTKGELKKIRDFVMGRIGANTSTKKGKKALIEEEDKEVEEDEEEKKDKKEGETSEGDVVADDPEGENERDLTAEGLEGEAEELIEVATSAEGVLDDLFAGFSDGFLQEVAEPGDYIEINQSYDTDFLSTCTM